MSTDPNFNPMTGNEYDPNAGYGSDPSAQYWDPNSQVPPWWETQPSGGG
jgi:hypothetical protein